MRLCKATEYCEAFTFNSDELQCHLFDGCDEVVTDQYCSNCISGTLTACDRCFIYGDYLLNYSKPHSYVIFNLKPFLGYCPGPYVGRVTFGGAEGCRQVCQEKEECEFWSYHASTHFCVMTSACDNVSNICGTDCVYGEKACKPSFP